MGSMSRKQGETVSLTYASNTNASPLPITLVDANGRPRPLLPTERLIIDMLSFDTLGIDSQLVYVIASVGTPAVVDPPTLPIIAEFTENAGIPNQGIVYPGEGYSLPVGALPFAQAVADAWASNPVAFSGSGRVVNGITPGPSANYKAVLTPNGNKNWQ